MPWAHCDQSILDTDSCPTCGLSKAEWTIQVDLTRTFQVAGSNAKRSWIEVQLLDDSGDPKAGADYRLVLPGNRVKKGKLDDEGLVRVDKLRDGVCKVSFPGTIDEAAQRPTGSRHVFGPLVAKFEIPRLSARFEVPAAP